MQQETISGSKRTALTDAPWARVIVEIESGGTEHIWVAFEDMKDFAEWAAEAGEGWTEDYTEETWDGVTVFKLVD